MAIAGFDRASFGTKLNSFVYPSQPVHSIEHLFGRTQELDQIEKALYAHGRHVFIYGDRGVGKSSLAATAANQYQSSDAEYIDVACSPDATLVSVVANIAYQGTKTARLHQTTSTRTATLDLKYIKVEGSQCAVSKDLHQEIRSLTDAVEVLREVAVVHSDKPIVVLDEFDRLGTDKEKNAFSDLVKHLGDKRVPLKFVFTGVGKSLDQLLGAHQSAIRQFETIELPKLSWDARWNILLHAANAFGITVDRDIYTRVAAVSDGYPYYVHLITEKMLWRVLDADGVITKVTWAHYRAGLYDAINGISAELKRPYEVAINQRSGDFEEILWSTADSEWLQRYLKDMFSSYEYIIKQIPDTVPLNYDKYSSRIRSLKTPLCGAILVSENRPGLYSYREKMLRGYVRMQAEAHNVELIGEAEAKAPGQTMHVPARASSGYHQSTIPKGVHFGRKRRG